MLCSLQEPTDRRELPIAGRQRLLPRQQHFSCSALGLQVAAAQVISVYTCHMASLMLSVLLLSPAAGYVLAPATLNAKLSPCSQKAIGCRTSVPIASTSKVLVYAQADKFFAMIDDNGDGFISVEELSEHLEERGLTEGARDHVFDLLDVNRDGEISQSELRESFVKYDDPSLRAALGLGETEADEIFNKIDVNGDGQISREELSTYLADQGHSVETVESVFSAFDDNGDGVISREELHEGYTTYSALRGILGLSSE